MLWQRLWKDQRGVTLVELIVGTTIAGLVLLAVASIEISSWRYRRADERAFAGQAEAATLTDRIAQDVRQATGITLTFAGADSVTLSLPGGPVTYQYNQQSREVLRQGRVAMQDASGLQFYQENGGRTLRAVVTAGNGYRLESRATRRLGP